MNPTMRSPCSAAAAALVQPNPSPAKFPASFIWRRRTETDRVYVSRSRRTQHHRVSFQLKVAVDRAMDWVSEKMIWPSPDDEIPFWKKDYGAHDVGTDLPVTVRKDSDLMHIIHVTAEMAPIAKVGGLGDVVTGLARACISRGHSVEVMLPFYECIPESQMTELALIRTYNSYHDRNWISTNAYRAIVSGIPVILIEPSNNFFKGQTIYGGSYNELEAYLFFSRACLEWMQVAGSQPDIIHVHEWQTSALPLLYWDMYNKLSLRKPRIVLTIHNMEHYGECRQEQLSKCGLDGEVYAVTDKAVDDRTIGHNPERLSLLKGGIVYSNAVVTVSPTYMRETLRSGWLGSTLITHKDKYHGVLNGVDDAIWNPATDIFLPAQFDAEKTEGKKICKHYVQRGLGLPAESLAAVTDGHASGDNVPLIVCITRLVAQKGLHLITRAIKLVEELGGQMVVLGKAPDARVDREFKSLVDLMIGMRYGAIPVVRKTGGLADTVFDIDDPTNPEAANGFVFEGIDEGSLKWALGRAFTHYKEKPDEWKRLVKKVMKIDNSWNNTAGKYISLYSSARAR